MRPDNGGIDDQIDKFGTFDSHLLNLINKKRYFRYAGEGRSSLDCSLNSAGNFGTQLGVHTADSVSITVAEAGDRWITNCTSLGLERTTIDSYSSHLEPHIKPFIGDRKLSQLTVPMVSEFERKLRDGTEDQKPRSAAMVKRIRSDLGALLGNAMDEGLVARNVVREMRSRRRGKGGQVERRSKRKQKVGVDIPLPEEIKVMIAVLAEDWRPVLLTAIFTGLASAPCHCRRSWSASSAGGGSNVARPSSGWPFRARSKMLALSGCNISFEVDCGRLRLQPGSPRSEKTPTARSLTLQSIQGSMPCAISSQAGASIERPMVA
jgi:hypothetical protein